MVTIIVTKIVSGETFENRIIRMVQRELYMKLRRMLQDEGCNIECEDMEGMRLECDRDTCNRIVEILNRVKCGIVFSSRVRIVTADPDVVEVRYRNVPILTITICSAQNQSSH